MILAVGPPDMNYTTEEDYDPEGADWSTCTTVSSSVQSQVDLNRPGHYRHRDVSVHEPWREGLIP